ncbi:MAG: hypothetical protein LAO56_14335 [Acidobacteriia bacterium]|nr:hypothetical protein [Terriglobia bacterium]
MNSFIGRMLHIQRRASPPVLLSAVVMLVVSLSQIPATAQTLAKRIILKDGSFQSVTKYEIKGERVHYFSAERGEWEDVPKSLVDWDATEKYEQGRLQGAPAPEAIQLDKELEAEQKAEDARSPHVAPGLRLPDDGGIFLLDTFQNEPQLAELQQSGGELNKNMKTNILRATINPLASAKQTIELPGEHAKIQSHTSVPSIYINVEGDPGSEGAPSKIALGGEVPAPSDSKNQSAPLSPTDRFKIIRAEVKGGKRVAGGIKIAVTGKMKADERFVAATVTPMTGGWVKLTPTEPLPSGEYAVAEMLGKEGMNLYVWDFGVNPSAPANTLAWKPDPRESQPKPDQPKDLQNRQKQ